jgi:hypothetical protein
MQSKRIFFTGVPGSRWSSIAQIIESSSLFNKSDRTENRSYSHSGYNGHLGVYFGEGMELPAKLDNSLIDSAWTNNDNYKIVKSHDWAYFLPEVLEHVKKYNDWLMLIFRDSFTSYTWWHEAGGFSIKHPTYSWYENSAKMLYEIQRQNNKILKFASENNLIWNNFTSGWCKHNLGIDVTVNNPYHDVLVTIIK